MKKATLLFLCLLFAWSASAQFRKGRARQGGQREPQGQQEQTQEHPLVQNEFIIAGIEMTGLRVLDKNAMISLSGLKVGDKIKIPGDATGNAIRKLWKHGVVGDAAILVDKVDGKNIYLRLELSERPRLSDFFFTGISKGRQSSLKDDLKLIRGKIVNDAMIRNTEVSVKKHFVKKGFLNTTVKITQVRDTLNRGNVRLKIEVHPNAKVKIDKIDLTGNEEVSDFKLKWRLKKTHEYARIKIDRVLLRELLSLRLSRLKHWADSGYAVRHANRNKFFADNLKLNFLASSKLIRTEYEEDKKKLLAFYNTAGYRDAEILSDTIKPVSKNSVDIHLNLFEGKKYFFRNITWTGNFVHKDEVLNSVLNIKKGDVYNRELLEKRLTFDNKTGDVSGLYMDDGYLFFRADPVEVAVAGDSIDVEIRIFEGEKATVNAVGIAGNERTNDHVVRRELSTIPGYKFRRSDIIRTQQQLSQSGYFNPQKIEPDIRPNPAAGTVDINWKMEEQSNDQVQLSGGWGGYYGFVGTLGLSFNNFSIRNIPHWEKWRPLPIGDGQRLSLQMQANGSSFQSYSISFTEPWLGGSKPHALTVSLNHSITQTNSRLFQFATANYYLKQTGITVGLGRRLNWPDNYFTLTNSLSYLLYNYKDYFVSQPSLPTQGLTNEIKLENTLSRNSIDSPFYPTSGSQISLAVILTPPYSILRDPSYLNDKTLRYKWIELYKIMFDSKFYLKIFGSDKPGGRSLVLESKFHFGYIGSYKKGLDPGPFERFVLGGAGLAGGFNSFVLGQEVIGLRGYTDNSVTPPRYGSNTQGSDIVGGLIYDKFGAELRYPVTTGQTATIYGLIFAEAGNNWGDYKKVNPSNMYRSAGFGARLFMPAFGLIGLNWAYGFDTLPFANAPSGSQFHFTIGQQIR